MKLRERLRRWWRPRSDDHPLSARERESRERAGDLGTHTLGGPVREPFGGTPTGPDDAFRRG